MLLCFIGVIGVLKKCHFDKHNFIEKSVKCKYCLIRTARIRHQCQKTTVLSCHRCLINTDVEKMNNILNIDT